MDVDLQALLAGQTPTPEEEMRAKADALQRRQAQQQMQAFGILGQLSGDKVLGGVGRSLMQGAEHQSGLLQQEQDRGESQLGRRLTLALQDRRDKETRDYQGKQLGLEGQRLGLEQQRIGQEAWAPIQTTQGLFEINHKTGQTRPVLGPDQQALMPPKSEQTSVRKDALVGRLSETMLKDLDPSNWKGPGEVQVKGRDRATHLLTLAENAKTGGFNNLDSREQEELAVGFNSLIAGGQGSESGTKALLPPKTLESGWAGIKEWLLNEPQGRDQVAFVERLGHSIERQKAVAEGIIEQAKAQRLGAHRKLKELDPDQWAANVGGAGMDPANLDAKGVYRAPAAAASATTKGQPVKYLVSPDKTRRVAVFADGSKGAEEPNP